MTTSVTRLYFTTQHKTCKTKTQTGFWSQTGLVLRPTVSDRITGLGSAVSSQCGSGRSRDRPKIFHFSALRMASPDIIIGLLLWIKKWKILNPFNLESITVHLMMLFDVFFQYETKFTIGKWQVVIFTAGKRRGRWGGIRHLGEFPSSAQLRPHGPWRTGEIRGPRSYFKR